MDRGQQCPRPSHSRPLRGPCHPDTLCPASSESGRPTTGPLCRPRQRLAARPQDQGYVPGTGDSPPREVSDSSLVQTLPSVAQESCGKPPPLPSQDPCPSGVDTSSPDPQGMSFQSSLFLSGKQRVTEEPPGGWEGRKAGAQQARLLAQWPWASLPRRARQPQASTYRPRTGMGTPRRATQQLPTPRTVAQLTHTTRPVAEQPFIKSHTIKLGLCSQDPPGGLLLDVHP